MKTHVAWPWPWLPHLPACGSSVKLDDVPVEDRAQPPPSRARRPGRRHVPAAWASVAWRRWQADGRQHRPPARPERGRIVYFDYDSYAVKPEFQHADRSARPLPQAPTQRRVVVEGHTDERGGREYNLALGQRAPRPCAARWRCSGVTDARWRP
jgi:peptidoglycan-associated lipoprotein